MRLRRTNPDKNIIFVHERCLLKSIEKAKKESDKAR
jgi:hypothetical protein